MWNILLALFLSGMALGTGPCLLSCGPVLFSYIAGTNKTPLQAIKAWLIFSLSRVLVYMVLGALAGTLGGKVLHNVLSERGRAVALILAGGLIAIIGIIIFLTRRTENTACKKLNEFFLKKDVKSMVTLGITTGIVPCLPLIGVISYIMAASTNYKEALLMSAAFGAGTLISPLFIVSLIAGSVSRVPLLSNPKIQKVISFIFSAILIVLGIITLRSGIIILK